MEFLVYNGHHTNFKVVLNADQAVSKPWYQRVVCRCEYTLALGRPCLHASFVLCELPSILEKKRLNRDYMQIFHYKMSIWYAPVFHVTQYVMQYTTQVVIPECDDLSNTAYRLFPPVVKPRKGRKKARLTKRRKTNKSSSAATSSGSSRGSHRRVVLDHNDASDDESSGEEVEESSSDDGGNAADGEADSDVDVLSRHTTTHYNTGAYIMPPLLGTQDDGLPVKPKPVLHCGWCGSTEHNRRVCDKKDIAYLFKLHNLFAVVQSAQPLSESILWQLSSDRAIARAHEVASATEEDMDGAQQQAAQTTTDVASGDIAASAIDFQTQQLLPSSSGEREVQYTDEDDYDAKHFRCLPCVLSVPNILGIGDLPQACEKCAAEKDGFNVLVLPAPTTVEDILIEMGVWSGSHYDKFMFDENIVTSVECHGGEGFSECYGMNINACNEEVPPFYDECARKVGRWWYWKGGDM